MANSVGLTWNLDRSADTTFAVARNVLQAATSDNVQPLALLTCERFGATLAICPKTTKKIEDLIIQVSGPKLLRFLSAQVGYSAHDATTQLSQSLAGVQFLALAAALVSSVELYEGADAVSAILTASAGDKTLLPTPRQLRDLLAVTEHRLNRSGFTDECLGYQTMLLGMPGISTEQRDCWQKSNCYPVPDGISKLVDAFRQLGRVGDATAVNIRAGSCVPWVMAFTKWCLGLPPSLLLEDGTTLLIQPGSQVTVFTVTGRGARTFDITIHKAIDSLEELLESEASPNHITGMVSIERLGQYACQEMGGNLSDAYQATVEALPYTLRQTSQFLGMAPVKKSLTGRMSKAFPNDSAICNALKLFFGSEGFDSRLQQLPPHVEEGYLLMENLPLVKQHLRQLQEDCICCGCRCSPDATLKEYECKQEAFLQRLVHYTALILAFSVFESPQTLLVHLHCRNQIDHVFKQQIYYILMSGKYTDQDRIEPALAWILACVGHSSGAKDVMNQCWVISCSKGQVVYPKMFGTSEPDFKGYLMMSWAPGLLRYNGEVHTRGVSTGPMAIPPNHAVQQVWDAGTILPNETCSPHLTWQVSHRGDYLEISLSYGHATSHPYSILRNMARGLVLEGCRHDRDSPLRTPSSFSVHRAPFCVPRPRIVAQQQPEVSIVDVGVNSSLQLFALSRIPGLPFVIRDNACVQCCLDICQEAKLSVVLY